MAMTNWLENKLIDHIFRGIAYTMPTELYVGLFTTAPSDTGGGTEMSAAGYARARLDPDAADWKGTGDEVSGPSAGTTGAAKNTAALAYPLPTADWGTATHATVFDQSGNPLFYGALVAPLIILNGDPAPTFPASALSIVLA